MNRFGRVGNGNATVAVEVTSFFCRFQLLILAHSSFETPSLAKEAFFLFKVLQDAGDAGAAMLVGDAPVQDDAQVLLGCGFRVLGATRGPGDFDREGVDFRCCELGLSKACDLGWCRAGDSLVLLHGAVWKCFRRCWFRFRQLLGPGAGAMVRGSREKCKKEVLIASALRMVLTLLHVLTSTLTPPTSQACFLIHVPCFFPHGFHMSPIFLSCSPMFFLMVSSAFSMACNVPHPCFFLAYPVFPMFFRMSPKFPPLLPMLPSCVFGSKCPSPPSPILQCFSQWLAKVFPMASNIPPVCAVPAPLDRKGCLCF